LKRPNIVRPIDDSYAVVDIRDWRYNALRSPDLSYQQSVERAEQYVFAGGPTPVQVSEKDRSLLEAIDASDVPDTINAYEPQGQNELFYRRDAGVYGAMLLWLLSPKTRQLRMTELQGDLQASAIYHRKARQAERPSIGHQGGRAAISVSPERYRVLFEKRSFKPLLDTREGQTQLVTACAARAGQISPEQLPLLLQVIAEGRQAQRALLRRHTPLVMFTARKAFRQDDVLPRQERLAAGYEGLVQAVQRYDPEAGFTFPAFAMRSIAGVIQRAADDKRAQELNTTRGLLDRSRRMYRHLSSLQQKLGREPTDVELAKEAQMREATVRRYRVMFQPSISLDSPNDKYQTIPHDNTTDPSTQIVESQEATTDFLSTALPKLFEVACLTSKEQKVLRGLYGLDEPEYTHEELAHKLGCPTTDIRRLERSARKKIYDSPDAATILFGYLRSPR
jgi:RNA polymerase sigma factor (sigma-70 family)